MLSALSHKDVANCQAVVAHAMTMGLTELRQLQDLLDIEAERYRAGRTYAAALAAGGRGDYPLCPSCGRSRLRPGAPLEGLRRLGCPACRYSMVVGD